MMFMPKSRYSHLLFLWLVFNVKAQAKPAGNNQALAASKAYANTEMINDLSDKVKALQKQVEGLNADISRVRADISNRPATSHAFERYANSFFFKVGVELMIPRQRSLAFEADTGLGVFIGIGQYFGENHVAEFGAEYDFYPAFSLRYRYEFHFNNPGIAFGPTVGYKIKVAAIRPWDDFTDDPNQIRNSFFFAGLMLGFPMNGSLGAIELLYLVNQQNWFNATFGVHFFF